MKRDEQSDYGVCPNVRPGMKEWCAACYTNLRGRTNIKGHRGTRQRVTTWRRDAWGIAMKRPEPVSESGTGQPVKADEKFVQSFPTVWSYLSDVQWDDGKAREPSALSLTWKEGMWQLALNDKALKQSLYTCGQTQQEALRLLEKALRDNTGVWRSWKRGR